MNIRGHWASALMLLAASGVCAAASLEYQTIPGVSPEPRVEGAGLKGAAELEAFLDGVMADQLGPQHIAGATLAVIKDGKLFFAKGYGYADVEQQIPVDAAATLFRPGSISKLFTSTAVMQLVEQNKLDLDADVNIYLTQFQIPQTFEQPVTLRNLLTHTAGFDTALVGTMWRRSAQELLPLAQMLKQHLPARVHPPVTDFAAVRSVSYCNWCLALAGLIVANVSAMDYDDYIEKNIFQPLGMASSTFSEPLPSALAAHMSLGYTWAGGGFQPHAFEFIHSIGPAGNLTTTAPDLAKFMIAHLQNGAYGDARILREDSARQMHRRQATSSPYLAGYGLGFRETWLNGRRLIGHEGGTLYFHSNLYLLPEENLGLFVSYNTAPTLPLAGSVNLMRAFMDRYYPARLPALRPPADAASRLARYQGSYRSYWSSFTTNEKALALFQSDGFSATADGVLVREDGSRWIEVKDGVFRQADSDTLLLFAADEYGRMHAVPNDFTDSASYRLRGYETASVHRYLLGLAACCFGIAIISALRNRKADRAASCHARWARPLAALLGLLQLTFLLLAYPCISAGIGELLYGFPPIFRYALVLPLVALPLTAAVVYFAVRVWRENHWTLFGRLEYSVIAVASVAFMVSLNFWNLIGYRFG